MSNRSRQKLRILLTTCLIVMVVGMNVGYAWKEWFYTPSFLPLQMTCTFVPMNQLDIEYLPVSVELVDLHNTYQLSNYLYSGSGPSDETSFRELQKRNIRTIISVDGATPDVGTAENFGINYIHIPIGYDGIPDQTAYQLARAYQTAPGPVYVHCHHGKHRGPAAVAAICLCLNPNYTPKMADDWMKLAGTDPKYSGLINLPKTLVRPSAEELNRISTDFPKAATVPDLTRHMVGIDERWDHLKLVKAAGWKTPPSHPDVDPAHEALQLQEHYREAARLTASSKKGEAFLAMMIEAEASASELEKHLRTKPIPADAAAKAFARNQALCSSCHERFRDWASGS